MKDDFCGGPWADNDGGLWRWKHRDVKGSDCVRCEFYAKDSTHMQKEEGNDDRQTLHDIDSTDGDYKRDPGPNGADGYLGLVNDTGSDPV